MNILVIHNSYKYPGGEETYVKSLKQLLESRGNKVYLYVKDNKKINTLIEKLQAGIGLFWNVKIDNELDVIIKNFKPDVAQFQNVFPSISLTAYWCCRRNKVPIIQRVSNYRLVCPKSSFFKNGKICELCKDKRFFYPSILHRCYNNSYISSFIFSVSFYFHKYIMKSFSLVNAFIFPSLFTKTLISKYFPINTTKTEHIPTFTSMPFMRGNQIKKEAYFIYAGRLSEEKGLLNLLLIFNLEEFKDITLYIVGEGPLKKEVEHACQKKKNIIYKGPKNNGELSNLLANSIALILPAIWYDVQPNIILETLSLGRPVIVPDTKVFAELIKHKSNGVLYKTNKDLMKYIAALWNRDIVFYSKTIKQSLSNRRPQNHYNKLIFLYKKLTNVKR